MLDVIADNVKSRRHKLRKHVLFIGSSVTIPPDDMAVNLFLSGRVGFLEIPTVIEDALDVHDPVIDPSPQDSLAAARWARDEVLRQVEG